MGFWAEDHFITYRGEYILSACFRAAVAPLNHTAEVVLVNFLHCNLTPFPSFHTVVFGSHHAQPVHKEWGVTFCLLEYGISTLSYSCIHICLFAIYLLNNLLTAVWTHKYLYFSL